MKTLGFSMEQIMEHILSKHRKKAAPDVGASEAARNYIGQVIQHRPGQAYYITCPGGFATILKGQVIKVEATQPLWKRGQAVRQAPPPVHGQGRGVWV